jgi:hypothetical protein
MIAHDCERFPDRGTRHSERILLPSREQSGGGPSPPSWRFSIAARLWSRQNRPSRWHALPSRLSSTLPFAPHRARGGFDKVPMASNPSPSSGESTANLTSLGGAPGMSRRTSGSVQCRHEGRAASRYAVHARPLGVGRQRDRTRHPSRWRTRLYAVPKPTVKTATARMDAFLNRVLG